MHSRRSVPALPGRHRGARSAALFLLAALIGAGCAVPVVPGGGTAGGGSPVTDGPGDLALAERSVEEAVRDLPKSARGNMREYTVRGRSYRTLASAEGYRERGVASWYGAKFHGRDTSSGEPFDMHAMTAAHRHLPLPTFVRVTNLANGQAVVVKVNDRGPFVDDRVLDLSYAAAFRLGMLDTGTAEVEIEALSTHLPPPSIAGASEADAAAPSDPATGGGVSGGGTTGGGATGGGATDAGATDSFLPDVIQIGAFRDGERAAALAERVGAHLGAPPQVEHDPGRGLWFVRVGPLADVASFEAALAALASAGVEDHVLLPSPGR